jgi:hypothetical protein
VIENKPGGGTNIAAAAVAGSDPDGYTIIIGSSSLATSRLLLSLAPLRAERPCAGHACVHVSSLAAGAQLIAREIGRRFHRVRQRE